MADRSELGGRKAAILRAVVSEYVRTGEPVGSETIAERYALGVSSATIRNEMAALEDLGYLMHPHTSAGRIPTDLGYRKYVDALPTGGKLRDAQRRAIADFFEQTVMDLEEVLQGTTHLLSRLTQYAGLAVTPSLSEDRIARVELIGIGSAVLLLVVGQHAWVHKRILDRPDELDDEAVERISRRLQDSLSGLTASAARVRALDMSRQADEAERRLLSTLAESLREVGRGLGSEHVLVGGAANLAGEVASWRRDTVRRLLEALERESDIAQLLREVAVESELSVTIGDEHPSTGLWEAAIVAAPYRAGATSLGTIGVVGPTRMDYLTVMAAVRAVARRVSDLASQLGM